jgi:hypothetical protein
LKVAGAAGAAAAIASVIRVTDLAAMAQGPTSPTGAQYLYSSIKVNPFKDPAYAEGMRQRLQQMSGGDPEGAKAVFAKMTSFEPEPWVAEWTKLAAPFEQKAAELESQGKMAEANKAWERASTYYGHARFPVINHPAKKAAYRKQIETWRKAIRSFDPPMEIVEIPFEGKTIYGHLRKPKGVDKPAVIIRTGGVDGYKEGRNLAANLNIGCAGFEVDMPGSGECPVFNKPDSEKFYVAVNASNSGRPSLFYVAHVLQRHRQTQEIGQCLRSSGRLFSLLFCSSAAFSASIGETTGRVRPHHAPAPRNLPHSWRSNRKRWPSREIS